MTFVAHIMAIDTSRLAVFYFMTYCALHLCILLQILKRSPADETSFFHLSVPGATRLHEPVSLYFFFAAFGAVNTIASTTLPSCMTRSFASSFSLITSEIFSSSS